MEEKGRLPEGIEWPRFKSGGPVGIGYRFTDRYGIKRAVMCIRFYSDKFCIFAYDGTEHYYNYGDAVASEPVIAADGVPLRKGDKPYRVDNSKQVEVRRVDPNYGKECVFVGIDGTAFGYWLRPDQLTHERPDSWERIEEDAGCTATKYNERRGTIFTTKQQVARDLVRRAKKLAGVSE